MVLMLTLALMWIAVVGVTGTAVAGHWARWH